MTIKPKNVLKNIDEIDFEKLPKSFVIKCNHGCKWQYIINDKNLFLQNKRLFEIVRQNITGWLEQEYWQWGGFELNYKSIEPKIIIEEFLGDEKEIAKEIEVYCFNGKPKIIKYVHNDIPNKISMFDENLNNIDFKFLDKEILVKEKANDYINQTFDKISVERSRPIAFQGREFEVTGNPTEQNQMTTVLSSSDVVKSRISMKEILVLSEQLAKDFKFVRVDWLIYQNKLYFNEMTFTPNSGLIKFDKKWNKKLGCYLNLKGDKNGF